MANLNEYARWWYNKDRKWIYLHRCVARLKVGRLLLPNEVAHHKDGNTMNYSWDNIEVITRQEHGSIHGKEYGGLKRKHEYCLIDNCKNKHHAHGLCKKHYARRFREEQGW